jgi:hypothetical protein
LNEDERLDSPSAGSLDAESSAAVPVANQQQRFGVGGEQPSAAVQLDPASEQPLARQPAQAGPEAIPASGVSLAAVEPPAAQAPLSNPSTTIDMKVQITLEGTVSEAAKRRIVESIQNQAVGFTGKLREVERSQRESGVEQAEFTASTVIKANEAIRRQSNDSQPGILASILAVVAPLSSAGAAISGAYLHSVSQAIVFGITATLAVIATVFSVVLPRLRSK